MTDVHPVIDNAARAIRALQPAAIQLRQVSQEKAAVAEAIRRGYFTPAEEEILFDWFARMLTLRAAFLETIEDISWWMGEDFEEVNHVDQWRGFLLGYAAACLLVGIDRTLTEELAVDSLTQRKLNEGNIVHRIPRKQYTHVFSALADFVNAWRIYDAMTFAAKQRVQLIGMASDPIVGEVAHALPEWEGFLDRSRRNYVKRLVNYSEHALRRAGASALQKTLFTVLEMGGRTVAEMHVRPEAHRMVETLYQRIACLLQPGDVIVTRHDFALSNLFLPGYWPHAALYIGSHQERARLGITADAQILARWSDDIRTLEALRDGVRFRTLKSTFRVDATAIIRPKLSPRDIGLGISRVLPHEGKLYNFDFDFFRSDRLVCTEVVYRAFDGVGGLTIPLGERAGRPTLSAEDLLDMALDGTWFEPVAVFGATSCPNSLVTGVDAREALAASYGRI